MFYLKRTTDLPLVLEVEIMYMVYWWVFVDFTVHPDLKIHTEVVMSLGKGAVTDMSKLQFFYQELY